MLRRKKKVLITHSVLVSVFVCLFVCVCVCARAHVCKVLYLELVLKFRALRDMMPYPFIDSYRHVRENTVADSYRTDWL